MTSRFSRRQALQLGASALAASALMAPGLAGESAEDSSLDGGEER